jgi:hypothetical protein
MALKIKKSYKQSDGTILEVEGTEAEIEVFEKKQDKRRQTENKSKERKLLLDGRKTLDKMTKAELLKLVEEAIQKKISAPERHIHHWYYTGGWWWRPWYGDNGWSYQYCNSNPYLTGVAGDINFSSGNYVSNSSNSFYTCNSVNELSDKTGMGAMGIYSSLAGGEVGGASNGLYLSEGGVAVGGISSELKSYSNIDGVTWHNNSNMTFDGSGGVSKEYSNDSHLLTINPNDQEMSKYDVSTTTACIPNTMTQGSITIKPS